MTQAEAALVAAVVAAVVALVGVAVNAWLSREALRRQDAARQAQSDLEMWSNALSYLEGRSQRRTVGIAMLAILRSSKSAEQYLDQVFQVFHTQTRYLLVHGSNRGEGHEVANLVLMLDTLFGESGLAWMSNDPRRATMLLADLDLYVERAPQLKREKDANQAAIDGLVSQIGIWRKTKLGSFGATTL